MPPLDVIELLTPSRLHSECQTETLSIQQVIVQPTSRDETLIPHLGRGRPILTRALDLWPEEGA